MSNYFSEPITFCLVQFAPKTISKSRENSTFFRGLQNFGAQERPFADQRVSHIPLRTACGSDGKGREKRRKCKTPARASQREQVSVKPYSNCRSITDCSVMRTVLFLDNHGRSHAAADAQRSETVFRVLSLLHLVDQGNQDSRAGCADRVS